MSGFKAIGVMVLIYTIYSASVGEVYAKDKWSGRTIHRSKEPGYFWAVIACYLLLSIACVFLF